MKRSTIMSFLSIFCLIGFSLIFIILALSSPDYNIYIGLVDLELLRILSPIIVLTAGAFLYGMIMFAAMSVEPPEKDEDDFVKIVSVKATWLCPYCDENFEQTLDRCPVCGYVIGTPVK